jgi:hypothetical protein
MLKFTKGHRASTPPPSGRWARTAWVAWRAGWVVLAAVSMAVTYVLLVVAGR